MFLVKEIVNFFVKLGLRIVPEPKQPAGYGVAMWKYTFNRLENVARIELEHGQDRRRDDNFLNLLQLLHRVGSYIGTKDPFYRLWMAFFFKQAAAAWYGSRDHYVPILQENIQHLAQDPEYEDFVKEVLETGFELKTCGGLFQIEQREGDKLNTLGRTQDAE